MYILQIDLTNNCQICKSRADGLGEENENEEALVAKWEFFCFSTLWEGQ